MKPNEFGWTPPRQPGRYDPVAACDECSVQGWEPSLTQQSQKDEADINTIVKRFGLTGQLPDNIRVPEYADFEGILDFHDAQNAIADARSNFNRMPAALRARFDNDPAQFHDFCINPDNLAELRDLGLAVPAKAPETSQGGSTLPAGAGPAPSGESPPGGGGNKPQA